MLRRHWQGNIVVTITEYLEHQKKSLLVSLGIGLFILITVGDYLTHTTQALEFSAFYLVPISFFIWFVGKRSGIVLAVASVLCCDRWWCI
jgi:hypothetical protein